MAESKSAQFHTKTAEQYDKTYEDKYWDIYSSVEHSKLNKYIPKKKSLILDAGGGTGKFSIEFAKKGHKVVMTEVSSGMIKVAKRNTQKYDVQVMHQDIRNMKDLKSKTFDFVVSLGDPVSYCMNEKKAVKELARVAKKGAYIMITVDSYFRQLTRLLDNKELAKLEKTGITTFPFEYPQYNFKVEELRKLFENNKLKVVEIFGLLNFISKIDKKTVNKLLSNDETYKTILKMEQKYCNEPSIIGTASHLGIVGRKT